MDFSAGEQMIILSASLNNSYLLFGVKLPKNTIAIGNKQVVMNVEAIESTTVVPQYSLFP